MQPRADEKSFSNRGKLPQDAIVIEAESTVAKDPGVEIVEPAGASSGKAVDCRVLSKAYYDANIAQAGTWYVWVRLFCPSGDSDSCWLGIEGAEPFPADSARDETAVRYYSDPGDSVNDGAARMVWYWDAGKGNKDPRSYFKVGKPGTYRLWLKGREAGTIIDTILLTMEAEFNPEVALKGGPIDPVEEKKPEPAQANAAAAANEAGPAIQDGKELLLWPGAAPGSASLSMAESIQDNSTDKTAPNRVISGVVKPSLTPFKPEKPTGLAMLIVPGGGYRNIQFDREGTEVAQWFSKRGITCFVLKYRLPNEGHSNGDQVPLQDAQRALRLIRKNAARWGIDPAKIGVMGFSAGGHLAATLATGYDRGTYDRADDADALSARPDFLALVYPNIGANDQGVNEHTPQTFIVMGDSDVYVRPEDSVRFYLALRRAKVPAELHFFVHGSHGFALRGSGPVAGWIGLFEGWLGEIGMLK